MDGSDVHRTWQAVMMTLVGTKAAGNLIDGVQWQQFPDVPA